MISNTKKMKHAKTAPTASSPNTEPMALSVAGPICFSSRNVLNLSSDSFWYMTPPRLPRPPPELLDVSGGS
jgi:hypothetical protein